MHPRAAFEQRVEVNPNGCWRWTGALGSTGYGVLAWEGGTRYAHRIAWSLVHGEEIPAGMVVRHTCDNRPCVRPDHLLIGTKADNSRDMVERGRSTRQTHCKRGHLLDGNRYFSPKRPNRGECQTCRRARHQAVTA